MTASCSMAQARVNETLTGALTEFHHVVVAQEAESMESMHALLFGYTSKDGFEISVSDDMHALPSQVHRRGRL